ncbi:hypothetical protein OSB04_013031 [Centaurea solstitialis]|uniref:non-specific serine/threonine protein kinase n=1 Tax=Centaurea solstitialis TaxID=347529 RepID=A0AA38TVI6_9ASTR|nr:hypothetical protein OSB04_013031 [Centaurea solstitialis]
MEPEFIALAAVGKEAEWIRDLLTNHFSPHPTPSIPMYCDSEATLSKVYNSMYNGKLRHIGLRHNYVRQLIENGTISIVYVKSCGLGGSSNQASDERLDRINYQRHGSETIEDQSMMGTQHEFSATIFQKYKNHHRSYSFKVNMAESFLLLLLVLLQAIISSSYSSSSLSRGLTLGSSLSVENKDDLLVSPNAHFTAGFHEVGENAYAFSVWFSGRYMTENRTVIWMANRDLPVNGKRSKLSLWKDGDLVLLDAGRNIIWSSKTKLTSSSLQLQLRNTGNLVLDDGGRTLWQSFDYPTDTLLPNQPFTKTTKLVSSKSRTNYSSGPYKMSFDTDGIIRLIYDAPETTTFYWPYPSVTSWEVGRLQYVHNRRAILDSDGQFNSSDDWKFQSADFGMDRQRIMRIDVDGNVRVYSLVEHESRMKLEVQWQAMSQPCKIHGLCGPNSLCTYSRDSGRECRCLPGYTIVNPRDPSSGCEPEFKTTCIDDDCDFIELRHVDFYGYDVRGHANYTVDACKQDCLRDNTCLGFQYGYGLRQNLITSYCFLKTSLQNGYELGHDYTMYIKLPKRLVSSFKQKTAGKSSFTDCLPPVLTTITRSYKEKNDIKSLGLILVFGCVIGLIEIFCIVVFWYFSRNRSSKIDRSSYFPAATMFRKFTYSELKKASFNFRDEIGRGGACMVYKGQLSDNRIAAIKRLYDTGHRGEAEFQAEISTIWSVNHMNLIETWGYCAEGKHRLVVYEYMENGSLADNLKNGKLDWSTRLDIATGMAKGLAYLHEETLEWVLHCDVKPHNILLDANYGPKVADFGLSRLFDRNDIIGHSKFSKIRGTRGYMAPEWVFNLPITSKVDVFSYGVVVLEMITGLSPLSKHHANGEVEVELIEWVKSRVRELEQNLTECWVEKIVDRSISGEYDRTTMGNLVRIALKCVEQDREARPSMSQVVSMILDV